jgi:hypothetical protein
MHTDFLRVKIGLSVIVMLKYFTAAAKQDSQFNFCPKLRIARTRLAFHRAALLL